VVPAAAAPAAVAVERRPAPKTRRGIGPADHGKPKAKRRRLKHEHPKAPEVKAERGKGANSVAAGPLGAQGPTPKAARPVRAQGPKPKALKVQGPKPKVEKPVKVKVEKLRGPKPKVEKPAKPDKIPPGQAKKTG
jgi:hypothetical protein